MWTEDSWLKQHAGETLEEGKADENGESTAQTDEVCCDLSAEQIRV